MSNKLTGTIKMIGETQQVSEKFSKREIVITDNQGMYPQDILFQITQDKCAILDQYKAGQTVEVSYNLRGREWKNPQGEVKYFNTLEIWRIDAIESVEAVEEVKPIADVIADAEAEDDLPF